MKLRHARLFLNALLGLLVAGCINVTQSIEINSNGTGVFAIDLGVSEALVAMAEATSQGGGFAAANMERQLTSNNPYIENLVSNEYYDGGFKHYSFSAEVTNMRAFLSQSYAEMGQSGLSITLEELDNGNLLFRQVILLSDTGFPTGATEMDTLAAGLTASALQGNYWTLTLRLPNVVTTNGRYDEESQTITWSVPMASLMNRQMHQMTAEFRPVSTGIIVIRVVFAVVCATAATALLASIVYFVVRHRRRTPGGVASAEEQGMLSEGIQCGADARTGLPS